MAQVESEAMREVEYETAARILRIRFAEGGWYSYFDVPPALHAELMAAESHGRFFHDRMRDRFRYRRGRS